MKRIKRKYIIIIFLFCLTFLSIFQLYLNYSNVSNFNSKKDSIHEFYHPVSSKNGFINSEGNKIFWFIQITDTQFIWFNQNNIDLFSKLLNETNKIIKPLFIIHTGDIVDANNGRSQNPAEWQNYNKSLSENKINSSIYVDLVGNHDGAENPHYSYFLNYSITGRQYGATQISFNRSFSFGNYAFIGINTAKDSYDNLVDFAFGGFLNTEELDWYENELKRYKDYDNILVFGHHPPLFPPYYRIISNLSSSGKSFYDLNKIYRVNYYFCGHIHSNYIQKIDGLNMIITDNFDDNNGTYRIVVIHDNQLSTSIESTEKWPQGLITYPPSQDFYDSQFKIDFEKIYVLAWDPKGIVSVEWSVYFESGKQFKSWTSLQRNYESELLWEGDFCQDLSYENKYIVKVKIEGNSGQIIREIIYNVPMTINYELIYIFLTAFAIGIIAMPMIILFPKKILKNKPLKKRYKELIKKKKLR
ncbi:MAG: metallophosphoesterase family protein [Promethearchaeota archaeon]